MTNWSNTTPTAEYNGVPYSNAVPLTSTEADLGDSKNAPDPIAIDFGQVIVAVVVLSINGIVIGNNCYVVMQTDMGDGVWVDVAWCVSTFSQSSVIFVLSGGGMASVNNSFQQTRQPGAFPASNGSNILPLGGRVRFVGKSSFVGGSSSSPGTGPTAVSATIKYRIMTPR